MYLSERERERRGRVKKMRETERKNRGRKTIKRVRNKKHGRERKREEK